MQLYIGTITWAFLNWRKLIRAIPVTRSRNDAGCKPLECMKPDDNPTRVSNMTPVEDATTVRGGLKKLMIDDQ